MVRKSVFSLVLLLALFFVSACSSSKQAVVPSVKSNGQQNSAYLAYINMYKDVAVEQMKEHKIPASITLAQGLLESNAGRSELASKSNNHFGIKSTSDWTGKKVLKKDNQGKSYYRVYKSARDSYEDHSKFLERPRYSALFELEITDYEGWARGLKKAGYAEDSKYPQKLIRIIELYQLHIYDTKIGHNTLDINRTVYMGNGLYYVRAREGDTFKSLSKELKISRRKLIKYNDMYDDYPLKENDVIYLQKKLSKALKPYNTHTVKAGESLFGISQMYGIRLERLYKMNKFTPEYVPQCGDVIKLR